MVILLLRMRTILDVSTSIHFYERAGLRKSTAW